MDPPQKPPQTGYPAPTAGGAGQYAPPGYTPGGPAPMGLPQVPGADQVARTMAPAAPENVPQIEHLLSMGQLWVQQRLDWLELFVNYDVSNTYEVYLNEESQRAKARWLMAKEESECIQRMCIPSCREFHMDVGLTSGSGGGSSFEQQMGLVSSKYVYPMVRIHRPCFFICQEYTVQDGRGNHIGSGKDACTNLISCCPIRQEVWGPGHQPGSGAPQYMLEGPLACWVGLIGQCPCRGDLDFTMTELSSGRRVGNIANVPNGWFKMCCSSADNYRVDFDPSANAAERGTLLSLTFLLDFRFFEQKQDKNSSGTIV